MCSYFTCLMHRQYLVFIVFFIGISIILHYVVILSKLLLLDVGIHDTAQCIGVKICACPLFFSENDRIPRPWPTKYT